MNEFFDSVRRTLGLFDSRGLKYSIEHLNAIRNEIIFYPMQEQAMYADQVCVQMVARGTEFLGGSLEDVSFPMNTTAVGNLAYIALYSRNEEFQTRAKIILSEYKKWATSRAL